ncbi:negative control protein of sporulation [Providencia rettgeri]|uniref:Negative control protein of sporulation n=1 Tax=Providencia rettgeri TaxID=587 RepID=A0AAW6UQP8_PRORE|nr:MULTISPECIES: negative control protein of sporulation [Providencia]MDI9095021.1 negative control protein of sporulation [Providencia rettgeri]
MSINIPLSLCVYNNPTQTRYDIDTGFNAEQGYKNLKSAYIVGIRDISGKILAASVFLSDIDDKKDAKLAGVSAEIFQNHKPTKHLVPKIHSMPISKLKLNLTNGTIKDAFSEREIDMLYDDFYMNNSIDGRG